MGIGKYVIGPAIGIPILVGIYSYIQPKEIIGVVGRGLQGQTPTEQEVQRIERMKESKLVESLSLLLNIKDVRENE